MQIALGIARTQHELLGCMSELRINDVAPKPHHLRRLVYQRTGLAEYLASLSAADFKAGFLENPVGRLDNALDLLRAQYFKRCPVIGKSRNWRKRWTGRASGALAPAAAGGRRSICHRPAMLPI